MQSLCRWGTFIQDLVQTETRKSFQTVQKPDSQWLLKNHIPGGWNFESLSKAALIFVTTSKRKTSALQTLPTVGGQL